MVAKVSLMQIALKWMPLDATYDMSSLVRVITWCLQARQQAIAWNNVDKDLWSHMASLFQNELDNEWKLHDDQFLINNIPTLY